MDQPSSVYLSSSNFTTGQVNSSCPYAQPPGCIARDPSAMPVTLRITMLNMHFMKITASKFKAHVKELQSFYFVKSAELEAERFKSLNASNSNQYMHYSINCYFDHQHHALISRVENSLDLVEKHNDDQKPPSVREAHVEPTKPTKVDTTNSVAIRIMTNWYERNSEHPYPSYETAEVIAKAGGITVEQVKKHFANRRLRLGHTKHITEIAKRRKRCRTMTEDDDILLNGRTAND